MKASSESGECASLISTGSFSVFEAVCWPGMGVLGTSFRAARRGRGQPPLRSRTYRDGLAQAEIPPKRLPPLQEALSGVGRKKTAAYQGLAWRLAARFLQGKA